MDRREIMLQGLDLKTLVGLEVGPLDSPLVLKDQGRILYADHCDTESLKTRWSTNSNTDVSGLHVDVVWRENSLREALEGSEITELKSSPLVDYVVASHVVEHVPDLVSWLREIRDALSPNGSLRLAVPDKRYTFDFLRRTTDLVDVADAFVRKRRVPSGNRVLDFVINKADVNCREAWDGELDEESLTPTHAAGAAIHLAKDAEENENYHDVHCWVFTPLSFTELMCKLASSELLEFSCEWLVPTRKYTYEFYVSMRPAAAAGDVLESWQAARDKLLVEDPAAVKHG